MEFAAAFDPPTFEGFLPFTYQGKEAGFEYFYQVLSGKELSDWGIGDPTRPACISFSTRANYRDLASSTIASSVFARSPMAFSATRTEKR